MAQQRTIQTKILEAGPRRNASTSRQSPSLAFDSTLSLLQLHAMIGNRAVGRMLQAKLKVNAPGDKYEQEADRVAERVMRMPEPQLQRACSCGNQTQVDGECEECRKKRETTLQRVETSSASVNHAPRIKIDFITKLKTMKAVEGATLF